jgi:hypothetical protein
MIKYTLPNQEEILAGNAFSSNGVNFPANWLELATTEDLSGHGITKTTVPDPEPPAPTKAELLAEADRKLAIASNAGTSVSITDTSNNAVVVSAATDADGKSDILGLLMQAQMGVTSWTWYQSTGSIAVNATALQQIAGAVAYHRGAVFAVWQSAVEGINGDTITTIAQLNALPWNG